MIVLYTDLDNTLIYSYKHDIGREKRVAERYQGRDVSFLTERTCALLRAVKKEMLVVPVSTRSVEQYERVDLCAGPFPYALACNGGILLKDGKKDEAWYADSLELAKTSEGEMRAAMDFLKRDARRKLDVRWIENLFVFTKCDDPDGVVKDLKSRLNVRRADVFCHGEKVYVVPSGLNKGMAALRFQKRVPADYVIAAGDSAFDAPMLKEADAGLAPYGFLRRYGDLPGVCEMDRDELFSEALLNECLRIKAART